MLGIQIIFLNSAVSAKENSIDSVIQDFMLKLKERKLLRQSATNGAPSARANLTLDG